MEDSTQKGGAEGVLPANELKLGKAGAIIWRGNQVYLCELYFDVPCSSSIEAEAKGMYLQLKRGLLLQYLIAYTDSMSIYNAVRGLLVDDINGASGGMYELLRNLRGGFKGFVPRWVPRSDLRSIDGLLRDTRLRGKGGARRQRYTVRGLIRQWSGQLSGEPNFTIEGKQESGNSFYSLIQSIFFIFRER